MTSLTIKAIAYGVKIDDVASSLLDARQIAASFLAQGFENVRILDEWGAVVERHPVVMS